MTAADTATAEAEITGITDQQLDALRSGGWHDDNHHYSPSWVRRIEEDVREERLLQKVFPSYVASKWYGNSDWEGAEFGSLDKAIAWCNERAGDHKPAEPGSATKQEDRFARRAAQASET